MLAHPFNRKIGLNICACSFAKMQCVQLILNTQVRTVGKLYYNRRKTIHNMRHHSRMCRYHFVKILCFLKRNRIYNIVSFYFGSLSVYTSYFLPFIGLTNQKSNVFVQLNANLQNKTNRRREVKIP